MQGTCDETIQVLAESLCYAEITSINLSLRILVSDLLLQFLVLCQLSVSYNAIPRALLSLVCFSFCARH